MFGFNNLEATNAKTQSKKAITTFKKFVITRSKLNENKPRDKSTLESSLITSSSLCHKGIKPKSCIFSLVSFCSSLVATRRTSPDLKCSFDKLPWKFVPFLQRPKTAICRPAIVEK